MIGFALHSPMLNATSTELLKEQLHLCLRQTKLFITESCSISIDIRRVTAVNWQGPLNYMNELC